jgi:hypothetical protein
VAQSTTLTGVDKANGKLFFRVHEAIYEGLSASTVPKSSFGVNGIGHDDLRNVCESVRLMVRRQTTDTYIFMRTDRLHRILSLCSAAMMCTVQLQRRVRRPELHSSCSTKFYKQTIPVYTVAACALRFHEVNAMAHVQGTLTVRVQMYRHSNNYFVYGFSSMHGWLIIV